MNLNLLEKLLSVKTFNWDLENKVSVEALEHEGIRTEFFNKLFNVFVDLRHMDGLFLLELFLGFLFILL